MSAYKRPNIPESVKRTLRQEAGFGCANCGHPYVEYHHIIPISEVVHNEPRDMVVLCGNCHPAISKLSRDKQYDVKRKPYNLKRGLVRGALYTHMNSPNFLIGGNVYQNCKNILVFKGTPLIQTYIDESELKISLLIYNKSGEILLHIIENEILFRANSFWDFQYSHNYVKARYRPNDIAAEIDLRSDPAKIDARFWLLGQKIRIGGSKTVFPGSDGVGELQFTGATFKSIDTVFKIT